MNSSSLALAATTTPAASSFVVLGATVTSTAPFGGQLNSSSSNSYSNSSSGSTLFGQQTAAAAAATQEQLEQLATRVTSSLEAANNKYGLQQADGAPSRRSGLEEEPPSFHSKIRHQQPINTATPDTPTESMMISKTLEGQHYVFNNITLRVCRDVLKPIGVDRCTLIDYVDDCANDEGIIDYVAFFFCAFTPDRMPLALFISVSFHYIQFEELNFNLNLNLNLSRRKFH